MQLVMLLIITVWNITDDIILYNWLAVVEPPRLEKSESTNRPFVNTGESKKCLKPSAKQQLVNNGTLTMAD